MALTQIKAGALTADLIDETKLADDSIDSEHYNDGSIDTAHIADDQVTLAKMAGIARGKIIYGDSSGNPAVLTVGSNGQVLQSDGTDISWQNATAGANRNLIINGAMQVAQRGTSSTSAGYQTVDRFTNDYGGEDEAPTFAQADVASGTTPYTLGFRKSAKVTNGNQTSGAGTADYIGIGHRIEAQNLATSGWNYVSASSYITLSFWVKSSVAQSFKGYVKTYDGSAYIYSFDTGSLSADTWTKVTKTIPGNSNLTIDNDNGIGLEFYIWQFAGTDFTASSVTEDAWASYASGTRMKDETSTWYTTNDATFEITGIQLEVSDHATDFEHRSFGDELNRCLRYCYAAGGAGPATDNYERFGTGWGYDSTRTRIQIFHPIPMRTAPTVSIPTIGDLQASDSSNGYQCSAYERVGSVNGAMSTGIQFTHSSGVTAHRPMFIEARNTTAARIILSAEL